MHVRHHIHKKLLIAQVNNWMMIRSLLIIIQFFLLKAFSRNVQEEAKCNIRSNGSAISKINRPGNRRKIFWINVLSNILSMAKGEISKNPVCSMVESQFSICLILRQCCVSLNQQINCIFNAHDKTDSSFATFINLSRGSNFMLSDNER